MRNDYSLDSGRACTLWGSDLASDQKAILGLVIRQGSDGITVRYFGSKAVLAPVPGNSQENSFNIWVVFQCVTAKCIFFSSLYRNGLINPDCAYSSGVQSTGMNPTLGWRFD